LNVSRCCMVDVSGGHMAAGIWCELIAWPVSTIMPLERRPCGWETSTMV